MIFSKARMWDIYSSFWRHFHWIQYIWKNQCKLVFKLVRSFKISNIFIEITVQSTEYHLFIKMGLSPIKQTIIIYLLQNPDLGLNSFFMDSYF